MFRFLQWIWVGNKNHFSFNRFTIYKNTHSCTFTSFNLTESAFITITFVILFKWMDRWMNEWLNEKCAYCNAIQSGKCERIWSAWKGTVRAFCVRLSSITIRTSIAWLWFQWKWLTHWSRLVVRSMAFCCWMWMCVWVYFNQHRTVEMRVSCPWLARKRSAFFDICSASHIVAWARAI